MFTRNRHPSDDSLVRRYMADRGLDALAPQDEGVVRHLESCDPCARRYRAVADQLDGAARLASDAADAAFSPERLLAQRERILRRLDGSGARVLAFPALDRHARGRLQSLRLVRWIGVAAAAGLLLGLSVGRMLNLGSPGSPAPSSQTALSAQPPVLSAPQVSPATLAGGLADDLFLSEVDLALAGRSIPELAAIETLTLETPEPVIPASKN